MDRNAVQLPDSQTITHPRDLLCLTAKNTQGQAEASSPAWDLSVLSLGRASRFL